MHGGWGRVVGGVGESCGGGGVDTITDQEGGATGESVLAL